MTIMAPVSTEAPEKAQTFYDPVTDTYCTFDDVCAVEVDHEGVITVTSFVRIGREDLTDHILVMLEPAEAVKA